MSRSDLYGWGLTFVGVALGYLIGGPLGALVVLLLGVTLIVMAHMRGEEKASKQDEGTLFGGHIPETTERNKEPPNPVGKEAEEPEPTLLSLMDTSFPKLNKLWGKPILTFEDGSSLQITSALYFDLFTSGAKFLGFHVPCSPRVLDACSAIAERATELGDALGNGGLKVICKVPGENPQTISDLRYSGKVYLYHDDALTHKQMADVEDMFRSQQLAGVLRGPDFLTQAWIAWKQKTPGLPSQPTPNVVFGNTISMQNVVEEAGRFRVFVPFESAKKMLAITFDARNPAVDGRIVASAGQVKAQLCFKLKQGEYQYCARSVA